MLFLFLLLTTLPISSAYPTILIHGIFSNKNELTEVNNYLQNAGYETYNMEIGNGKLDSIFMNMNKQCEVFSNNIEALNLKSDKINLLGISQGGLIARCYLERYSDKIKKVNSLITWATPHMGLYDKMDYSFIGYWKDPYNYKNYLEKNTFLPYINNELVHNESEKYKSNLQSLSNFVLFWSSIDTVITPIESSQFEFYNIRIAEKEKKLVIQPLVESEVYKTLGLNELDEKLHLYEIDCIHNKFKERMCFEDTIVKQSDKSLIEITMGYLN